MSRESNLSQIESEREVAEQQALSERGPDEVLAAPNPGVIVFPSEGPALFPLGLSGSLTKLTDGSDYLVAGNNISLSTSSSGAITITVTGDVGGGDTEVQFNDGGSALSGSSSFAFNKTTNTLRVTNLSGSLTKLSDGEDYLVAGNNISLSTGSNGAVTIAALTQIGGGDTEVQFNDGGNALSGSSSFAFNKTTNTLKVTNLSGSLTKLANGSDYLVAGSNIALSTGSSGNVTISSTFQTWGSYTPTITGITTNPTPPTGANLVGTYVVQGKTMTLNFNLSCATTTGAAAGSGTYKISMPAGYTIDTNYASLGTLAQSYNDGSPLGMSVLLADVAGAGGAWAVIPVSTTEFVLVGQNPANATGNLVWGSSTFGLGVATNYRVSFIASVPIV